MPPENARSKFAIAFVVAAVALILILIGVNLRDPEPAAVVPTVAAPKRNAPTVATEVAEPTRDKVAASPAPPVENDLIDDIPFLDADQELAIRWSQVDLEEVRRAMPDNLYWELGAPTTDPAVILEREQERARWNEEFGQVLSGNASEATMHDYFAQRHRLSSDYVEFASHLLDHYGDVLPARDKGLLEFSVTMHQARLQQMPRRLVEALERKDKQDRLREAWLADEAAFEQALPDSDQSDTPPLVAP